MTVPGLKEQMLKSYISTEEDLEESDETSIYGNISRNGLRMVEEVMIQTYEPLEQVILSYLKNLQSDFKVPQNTG